MLFPPLNPPPPTILDIIGNYILLGAGIAAVAFLITYGLLSNWRKTSGGQSIFFFVSGLAAVFVYSIASRFIGGDYLFRDLLRASVYGYVFVVSVRLFADLVRTQLMGNHPRQILTAAQRRVARTKARLARKELRIQKSKRRLERKKRRATKKDEVSGHLPLVQDQETASR